MRRWEREEEFESEQNRTELKEQVRQIDRIKHTAHTTFSFFQKIGLRGWEREIKDFSPSEGGYSGWHSVTDRGRKGGRHLKCSNVQMFKCSHGLEHTHANRHWDSRDTGKVRNEPRLKSLFQKSIAGRSEDGIFPSVVVSTILQLFCSRVSMKLDRVR